MIAPHRAYFFSGTVLGVALGLCLGHFTLWRTTTAPGNPTSHTVVHPGTPFEYSLGPRLAALPMGAYSDAALHEVHPDDEPANGSPLRNAIAISRDEQGAASAPTRPIPPPVDEPQPLNVETAQPILQQSPKEAAIVRALIDSELVDLPQHQREVWYDALKEESREDAAGILRMWKLFGGPLPTSLRHDDDKPDAALQDSSQQPGYAEVPDPVEMNPIAAARQLRLRNIEMAFTVGYQRQIPYFEEIIAADGSRSLKLRSAIDFNSTTLISTGFPLDVAIQGPGFFQVTDDQGETYLTRKGRFTLNQNRELVVLDGDRELRLTPPTALPEEISQVIIEPDGQVVYFFAENTSSPISNGGKIVLSIPLSPERLECLPNGLFRLPPEHQGDLLKAHLPPVSPLRQGMLEVPKIDVEAERSAIQALETLR